MSKKNKNKKDEITYVDDNSTIADMSGTRHAKNVNKKKNSTFKEKRQTFFSTMKQMVLPMLVTLTIFTLAFLMLLLIRDCRG
ncbi:MAG: hypothetical protein K2N47_00460 [Clostridia bacterium]|nr:hypothetical protein [Clostridia bacterium]